MEQRRRAAVLDEARGLAVVLMVLHHAAWDLQNLFGAAVPPLRWPVMGLLQPLFAGVFVVISGMVCRVARSNLRRGLLTLACAGLVTAATRLALPGNGVAFGILHLLGCAMVFYALARPLLERIPAGAGLGGGVGLFFLTWRFPDGILPPAFYRLPMGFVLGLPGAGFSSADYFPLLPWLPLFLAGSFAGRWVFGPRAPGWLFKTRLPRLAWVGRHSLWIYLLHQPLIYGALWAAFRLFGTGH